MKLTTLLLSSLFALLFLLAPSGLSLPLRHAHRRHHARRQLSAHDYYEAQLHKIEAALDHYEQYGDAQSLKLYLDGFASTDGTAAPHDQNDAGDTDVKKQQAKQQPAKDAQQAPQKQQNDNPHEDDCQEHDRPAAKQPQPQSKKNDSAKQNVSDPSSPSAPVQTDPSAPAPPQGYIPSQGKTNTLDGYTPPAFSTSSSPSTASLYTSPAFVGRATYYNTGLGACGTTNTDNQPIVAVSKDVFEQYNPASGNPNHNSLCGRQIEISYRGKTIKAFAMDECPTCNPTSLDLSPSVFAMLASKQLGVLDGISWRFV